MIRLGILGSTRGTNLVAILEAIQGQKLVAKVSVILSNKQHALILEKGKQSNIPSIFVDPNGLSRDEYDVILSERLMEHRVDYVILIGYMRILSLGFVTQWNNRILNIHPSLLPKHAGKMDLTVHQAVLDAKEEESGCTVHFVIEEVDEGPILLQKRCPVFLNDTAATLKERVQALEGDAWVEALRRLQ